MRRFRSLVRFRSILLVIVFVALASVAPIGTDIADAEYCGTGFYQRFYSDATLTTQVGTRLRACNGVTYTSGQLTIYSTVTFFECCS
jgi:hypothetical protein